MQMSESEIELLYGILKTYQLSDTSTPEDSAEFFRFYSKVLRHMQRRGYDTREELAKVIDGMRSGEKE